MRTQIINSFDTNSYASSISRAAGALREGALVVFPTETVYGVAANAARPEAVRRMRQLKQAVDQRPFTVHLGQPRDARQYVRAPSPLLRRLARKTWPGPVTLVAEEPSPEQTPVARCCPAEQLKEIFYGGTVGLRCPDHPVAQRLLSEAGVPVIASSANRQGQPAPRDLEQALDQLGGRVEYALDGRQTRFTSASTVVEVRGNQWRIVRPGPLDERTLARLARSVILFVCTGNSCRSPMAEYLFRHKLAERLEYTLEELAAAGYEVWSAGTCAFAGGEVSTGARAEMAQRGIDVSGHRAQPLTVELIQQAERIWAMSAEHRVAVLDLAPGAAGRVELLDPDGPVADPMGAGTEEYRRCAAHIERLVDARLEEFLNEDRNW